MINDRKDHVENKYDSNYHGSFKKCNMKMIIVTATTSILM